MAKKGAVEETKPTSRGKCEIGRCSGCKKHEFQDSKYGANNRVMNITASGKRCTICGREQ